MQFTNDAIGIIGTGGAFMYTHVCRNIAFLGYSNGYAGAENFFTKSGNHLNGNAHSLTNCQLNTKAGVFVYKSWDKGTFPNVTQSVKYHYEKHANGRTITDYIKRALDFFQKNQTHAKRVALKNGKDGYSIKLKEEGRRAGGFWTVEGNIITFWD